VTAPRPRPEPDAEPLPDFDKELELSYRVYQPLSRLATEMESQTRFPVITVNRWFPFGAQAICLIQGGTAFIAFRGSESWLDWYVNLLMLPVPRPMRHLGFTLGWLSCRCKILDWLSQHRDEFDAVVLTGHSLGGALAMLAAHRIAGTHKVSRVVTFGAPKVYWHSASSYEQAPIAGCQRRLSAVTYRVIHHADVVTDLPPFFAEAGRLIYLDPQGELLQGRSAEERRTKDREQRWMALNRSLDPDPNLQSLDSGGSVRYWVTVFFQAYKPVLLPAVYFWQYLRLVNHMIGRGRDHLIRGYANGLSITHLRKLEFRDLTTWEKGVSVGKKILLFSLVWAPSVVLVLWATYQLTLLLLVPWLQGLSGGP